MNEGEVWAYRARSIDDVVAVRVIRHGTKTPARVLVRFEDPSLEGREEWVPPARLKVLWSEVDAFRAEESRWDAVRALSPSRETAETLAVDLVFETLVADDVAHLNFRAYYLIVEDVEALATRAAMPTGTFTSDTVGFDNDGSLVVSWPIALLTAKSLARRHPQPLVELVDQEERTLQHELIHGHRSYDRRGRPEFSLTPEEVRKFDDEYHRPRRELVRTWCGPAAFARWDELVELRKEIHRVGDIAERAIALLRGVGARKEAEGLDRELGQTVDMIRPADD